MIPTDAEKTIFAYVTPADELRWAIRAVGEYDLFCPFCFWGNSSYAIWEYICGRVDFSEYTCRSCKKVFEVKRKEAGIDNAPNP